VSRWDKENCLVGVFLLVIVLGLMVYAVVVT